MAKSGAAEAEWLCSMAAQAVAAAARSERRRLTMLEKQPLASKRWDRDTCTRTQGRYPGEPGVAPGWQGLAEEVLVCEVRW